MGLLTFSNAVLTTRIETQVVDGVSHRVQWWYRGTNLVMHTSQWSNKNFRAFYSAETGYPCLGEWDRDGDGLFEEIHLDGPIEIDQFRRRPDGTVEPISEDEYRQMYQELKTELSELSKG